MIIISTNENLIDKNGWDYPVEEIDYLIAEHSGKTFVLKNGRLYETKEVSAKEGKTSISIAWMEKWANKNCRYCLDYDYPTEKTDGWYDIMQMIEEWEKENSEGGKL